MKKPKLKVGDTVRVKGTSKIEYVEKDGYVYIDPPLAGDIAHHIEHLEKVK